VPAGGLRDHLPISGSEIRRSPWAHWDFLPEVVRPYYVGRISIFGPESTGKTTLAARLAAHYRTVWVPEYARTWLELTPEEGGLRPVVWEDMAVIARGQRAAEEALARQANRRLFCDTDPAATRIWSEVLFSKVPVVHEGGPYCLTLLLDVDVPWEADTVRYLPQNRGVFFRRCRDLLEERHRAYRVISGSWEDRWRQSVQAVDELTGQFHPAS
jgi:NadR type nicotinamide-nucleotide adenylyltransferase